jgi:hypothetical protein
MKGVMNTTFRAHSKLDSRGHHRTVAGSEHRKHFVFLLKASPGESPDIPHARRVRAALQRELPARAGEQWAVIRIMWKELLRARDDLPPKLERAIDCMRFIAGRTKFAHSLKLSLQ